MKLSARPKASLLAITAILMALGFVPALSTPSRAQDAAQEPPGRVGRLVLIDGTVSYHTADQNYWSGRDATTPSPPASPSGPSPIRTQQ
jgi:hypothetical protein